jgi:hypothetical protein
VCEDDDPCTKNECDPDRGCSYSLIDEDGDGHAPTSLGSCGDDCDDGDRTVYQDAEELCDGKDNNCKGGADEFAPTWYSDCDNDGFAPTGATAIQDCDPPTQAPPSCANGGWVAVAPASGTTDCADNDPEARPRTTATENNSAWQGEAIAGAAVNIDFDYNCDGVEEPRYPTIGGNPNGTCGNQCDPCGQMSCCFCAGSYGYTGNLRAPPACGTSPEYTSCGGIGCTRITGPRLQTCR